jgi:predicted dehydrogenase
MNARANRLERQGQMKGIGGADRNGLGRVLHKQFGQGAVARHAPFDFAFFSSRRKRLNKTQHACTRFDVPRMVCSCDSACTNNGNIHGDSLTYTDGVKIALIGCGNISETYLNNAPKLGLEVVSVSDLDAARAAEKAQQFNVKALPLEAVYSSEAEAILNLTIPAAHGEIALRALESGKHIYNEKPLALSLEEAKTMLALAKQKGLRIGCAPDTFLGAGLQTAREFLETGGIGQPVGASLHMVGTGPDTWHPNPSFFFQPGAGPLFDMGPYYITAMVHLFGAVKRVSAFGKKTRTQRQDKHGNTFAVEVPTHITALLEHKTGVLVTLTVSFDAVRGSNQNIEIYGSSGALITNDPNEFGGTLRHSDGHGQWGNGNWHELPMHRPYAENSRGIGLKDMIEAIQENRPHRASGELAFHVLETMHAILGSVHSGQAVALESSPDQPALLEAGVRNPFGR